MHSRVVLGFTGSPGGVKSNGLVAEDVVAGLDARWNLNGPRHVVGDHLVVTKGRRGTSRAGHSNAVDLEPLEGGLVNSGAVTTTVGKVVDHRTVMRFWPCGPLKRD